MDHWMSMFAPQLQSLVALDRHNGHMTRAAQSLGIPQSSMSRRISALEADLRIPLLIHSGRTVRLTTTAVELAARVRPILHELGLAVDAVVGEPHGDGGTVRFGFPLTMGSGQLPDLLARFHLDHPEIIVTLTQAHGSQLTASLLTGEIDLAVVIPPPKNMHSAVIGSQPIYAAVAADHRLASAQRLRLSQLRGETFIANPASYHLRSMTEQWCADAGFVPAIAMEVTEFATIRELVTRGLGVALLPHDDRAPEGMREIPLARNHRRAVALAWATATLSPATAALHEFILRSADVSRAPR